jgi:hypothetical protein
VVDRSGSSIPEYDNDDDDESDSVKSSSTSGGASGMPPWKSGKKSKNAVVYLAVSLVILSIIGSIYYFMFSKKAEEVPDEEKPITVLIVGNDTLHTNDVPNMLREVAKMSKSWRPLEVTCIAKEDYSLSQHVLEKEAESLIKQEPWDFVVLQDRWLQPLQDPAGMLESVGTLTKSAREKGSRVILFVPWADAGEEKRQAVLSAVSRKLAERLSLDVAPAGDVFFKVVKKHKDINPYVGDNHHVNSIGAWLAAATLYSVITNQKAKLIADKFTYQGNDGEEPHVPITGDEAVDVETQVWQTVNEENPGRRLGPPVNKRQVQGLELTR